MRNLAIIPARGGSKRIPRKNIKEFLGKPIIAYSIDAALKSKLFDEVMVSTDDEEIAEVALKLGANIPFFRSKDTANDYAGLAEVAIEVIKKYRQRGKEFNNVCCILSTAPFLNANLLSKSFDNLINNKFDALLPVVKYTFPIQRAMQFDNNKIKMISPENLTKRSQDLKESFHDAGMFYWVETKIFLDESRFWTDNTGAICVSENEAQYIDTLEDWKIAENKFRQLKIEK